MKNIYIISLMQPKVAQPYFERNGMEFFGPKAAYALLRIIEAAVQEKSNVVLLDKERRLQRALAIMSEERLAA